MKYADEEAQILYHRLPTQTQLDWLCIDELLTEFGYCAVVSPTPDGMLEVSVRINEKPNVPPLDSK